MASPWDFPRLRHLHQHPFARHELRRRAPHQRSIRRAAMPALKPSGPALIPWGFSMVFMMVFPWVMTVMISEKCDDKDVIMMS